MLLLRYSHSCVEKVDGVYCSCVLSFDSVELLEYCC